MWRTTREVARFIPSSNADNVVIEIVKELNQESLDGILEWSHCWVITVNEFDRMEMHAFKIIERIGRRLVLDPLGANIPNFSGTIIDIKPIHACDVS